LYETQLKELDMFRKTMAVYIAGVVRPSVNSVRICAPISWCFMSTRILHQCLFPSIVHTYVQIHVQCVMLLCPTGFMLAIHSLYKISTITHLSFVTINSLVLFS
jgi:hypothetical protein